jgi:hypothetical protein
MGSRFSGIEHAQRSTRRSGAINALANQPEGRAVWLKEQTDGLGFSVVELDLRAILKRRIS